MNATLKKLTPWFLLAYTFLVCFFITQLPLPFAKFGDMNFDMFPRMMAGVAALGILFLYYAKVDVSKYISKEWGALNLYILFVFSAIYILFRDNSFGLNGLVGDASFNAAMVTKYKYFNTLTDFNYAQLTTSYPALYHFALGKYAALFGIESYTAIWHGYILVCCVLAVPVYLLFKRIAGAATAVAFVLFMFLNFPVDNLYKPYEFITAVVFLGWWIYFIEGKQTGSKSIIIGGLIGAIIFVTYYYWFFIAAVYLIIKLLAELTETKSIKQVFIQRKNTLIILLIAAIGSSFFWLPLGLQFARYGVESLQNMWLVPEMNEFVFLKEESLFTKLILAVGAIIPFIYNQDKTMQVCRWLLVALALWFSVAYLLLYMGKPVVANKIHFLAYAVCAFNLFYWLFNLLEIKQHNIANNITGITLVALIVLGADNFLELRKHNFFTSVKGNKYPAIQQNDKFITQFKNKVMLTDRQYINAFVPVHYLININAHFSHPASGFRKRIEFLKDMQSITNPQVLAWFLAYNKFDKVDLVFFTEGASMRIYDDNFPWGHNTISIFLNNGLFSEGILRPFAEIPGEKGIVYELIAPPFDLKNSFSQSEKTLADKYAKPNL